MSAEISTAQLHRFGCDTCGADMRFSPETGGLTCDHCGNQTALAENPPARDAIVELDLDRGLREALPLAETQEVRITPCENCGAQVEFADAEHAQECPFCATPVVASTGAQRNIKPKGLLP